jgi:broad-specificity NMP kinase
MPTETHCIDIDATVLDAMEELLANGGVVVDYHCNELFPQRWFDLVLVLTVDTEVLYDRLKARFVHHMLSANRPTHAVGPQGQQDLKHVRWP